jgi:uncharacterized protein with HEPN domain
MLAEDRVRLRHMIKAAEAAVQFLAGRQRIDLEEDRLLLFAVVRAIEVLGEAASKISEETWATHTNISWRALIGMRNRLMHAYFEIKTEIVWQTVPQEIPALLPQLWVLAPDE